MKYISVSLDRTFNVLGDRSNIEHYEFLAETDKEVVYTPKNTYRFLVLDKQDGKFAYKGVADKVSISEVAEGDYFNKCYGECYYIRLFTEESVDKAEKNINKEFQKWLNAKLTKYGASTTVNIISLIHLN